MFWCFGLCDPLFVLSPFRLRIGDHYYCLCTDLLKIYCVPATRPHARLLTVFVGDGGTWCYIGFRLEIPAVYFCRVFVIFGAEMCIYAASRILIAGVSPRRVVSHRPGGVLWRALTKACGAIGEYCFDTLAGDDVASNTLTCLSARGELLNCFGALSSVIYAIANPYLTKKQRKQLAKERAKIRQW